MNQILANGEVVDVEVQPFEQLRPFSVQKVFVIPFCLRCGANASDDHPLVQFWMDARQAELGKHINNKIHFCEDCMKEALATIM